MPYVQSANSGATLISKSYVEEKVDCRNICEYSLPLYSRFCPALVGVLHHKPKCWSKHNFEVTGVWGLLQSRTLMITRAKRLYTCVQKSTTNGRMEGFWSLKITGNPEGYGKIRN